MVLGVKAGTTRLEPHCSTWASLFLDAEAAIASALGELAIDIQHIGSTAVPGLDAKPILDIGVAVRHLEDAVRCIGALEAIGYCHLGYRSEQMGHVFERVNAHGRTHCIHVLEISNPHWADYLLLRDYLARSQEARLAYGELKRSLAAEYAADRKSYTAGKGPLIRMLLDQARNDGNQ